MTNLERFCVAALVGAITVTVWNTPDDQQLDQEQYCKMVHLHEVDHTVGWPDFRHLYSRVCNKDGSAKETYTRGR